MKKLTKREKLLIYVLACLVIVSGGIYFVALPAYERYATVSSQAAEAEFTQESMTMAIEGMPSTMTAGNEANAKLTTLKAPFSVKLANEGLDVLLTQLCLSYSLTPTMLSIEDNSEQDVPYFIAYSTGAEGMIGTGDTSSNSGSTTGASNTTGSSTTSGTNATGDANATTGSSSAAGTNSTTGTNSGTSSSSGTTSSGTTAGSSSTTGSNSTSGATATENSNSSTGSSTTTNDSTQSTAVSSGVSTWTGVVSMELTGTQADFYRLLDAVSARPDMIISSFEIAPKAATSSSSTTSTSSSAATQGLNGGAVTISVTFNVYMVDK